MNRDFLRGHNYSKCPCDGCQERHIGCHGKCPKYIEWRVTVDQKREAEYRRRESLKTVSDAAVRTIWRKSRYQYQQKRTRSDHER